MSFLTLTDISKTFKDTAAVADFNLDVTRGEFVSFLGPSGCGKTTTLRMIAGFETPTTGSIVINGEDITYRPPNRRNVGMVFQSYALFPNMTVAGNIGFGLKVTKTPAAEIQKTVAEMLDVIHLPELGARYPYQLSGGQQQRVALARALAIHPQVLLLDEPLSALDAKIRVELRSEIRRIQQELGITTIYVTHDQEEALSLSDRIVVMNGGRVEQIGPPFEIYNYPRSSFVASFIGQLNQLPVIVKDASAGAVAFGSQIILTGQRIEAANGTAARLAIRPEEIKIEAAGASAAGAETIPGNRLSARVDNVTFLGAIVRVRAAVDGLAEGPLLAVDLFNDRQLVLPKPGGQVILAFPPHACWVAEHVEAS
jgi:putative spermidine/putrescine transport system ATP-binding protein